MVGPEGPDLVDEVRSRRQGQKCAALALLAPLLRLATVGGHDVARDHQAEYRAAQTCLPIDETGDVESRVVVALPPVIRDHSRGIDDVGAQPVS